MNVHVEMKPPTRLDKLRKEEDSTPRKENRSYTTTPIIGMTLYLSSNSQHLLFIKQQKLVNVHASNMKSQSSTSDVIYVQCVTKVS